MVKSTYVVILNKKNKKVWKTMKKYYRGRCYIINKTVAFIRDPFYGTPDSIRRILGFDEIKKRKGMVVSYFDVNGYYNTDLWRFLGKKSRVV